MNEQVQRDFLRKRMIELREKNHKTQSEMADLIGYNKSTLSRAEKIGGNTSYKTILSLANAYCDKLGLTPRQKDLFLRGDRIVVTDTSALLKNIQLIDELSKEYSRVIVPGIVVDELDTIKDRNTKGLAAKAWQILKSIGANPNVITRKDTGEGAGGSPDSRIVDVAEKAAEEFHCQVEIITYDAGFAARLSGHATVKALYLEEYMVTKQNLMDLNSLKKIDEYYADSYDDLEKAAGITIPNEEDINAYLPNGNTLIISVVRNRKKPLNQRKEKIRWLIRNGADVNRRDCGKYYFPPLSHAIQNNDFDIFKFLLHECKANPNVGSRNPYDAGKVRQKNDGNMPLMIAAWDNRQKFVRELCDDERTSLNQQDANGFTALTKACYWGWLECRDIIKAAGADEDLAFLEAHGVNVGFSIDGFKELHDRYRCNSFDRAMRNVEHYKQITGHYPTFNATVGRESLSNAERVISFFKPFGTRVTFSRMIGRYGISLQEYRDFMSLAEKEIPVRRGGMDCAMGTGRSQQLWPSGHSMPGIRYDCTMYGGQCGAGRNNYFFANGKVYYCGNCIDLPPVGDSSMSFEELERISLTFDRSHCYKEAL